MRNSKPTQARVLAQLLQAAAHQQLTVEQVVLFGSHARNQAGPDSDYDLLVLVSDDTSVHRQWQAASELSFDLGYELAWPVDVLVTTPTVFDRRHDPMIEAARRTGKTIFIKLEHDARFNVAIG